MTILFQEYISSTQKKEMNWMVLNVNCFQEHVYLKKKFIVIKKLKSMNGEAVNNQKSKVYKVRV